MTEFIIVLDLCADRNFPAGFWFRFLSMRGKILRLGLESRG